MPRRSCLTLVTVFALLTGALSGCAGATATDPALHATLVQQRSDVASRQAQVMIVNDGDTEVSIGAVAVEDPRLAEPATRVVERTSRIAPGAKTGIRVQLPEAACDAADEGEAVTVAVDYESEQGTGTLTLSAPDTLGFLPGLHERECRAQHLARAVTLGFTDFVPSVSGEPATLVLEAVPTGTASAAILDIRDTNLLLVGEDPAKATDVTTLGMEIDEHDESTVRIELPLLPFRCDAHGVQEDKRGTIFTLDVTVDGETGPIELPVPEQAKGRILSWVMQWCGLG